MKITILETINSIYIEDMTNEQFNFLLDAVLSVTTKDTESEDDF
jgi:hypothetical protein